MASEIRIESSDLRRVARQLRTVGAPAAVRREMVKALKVGAQPAKAAVQAASAYIPDKPGGKSTDLKRRARRAVNVQVRTTGKGASAKLRISKRAMGAQAGAVTASNRPIWRHPVFSTGKWVTQPSTPGWFDRAAASGAPAARAAAKRVLDDMERRMTHH